MRKNIAYLLLAGALLSGCASNDINTTSEATISTEAQTTESITEAETTVAETTEPQTTLSEEEAALLEAVGRSHLSFGNNNRIKKVIEKAKSGETVTIAYIGGSITEGYNAGTTEIYAKLTSDYFAEKFALNHEVNYVNAGISGTPSSLGIIRSDRDVFCNDPDILFVEFAVNDGGVTTDINAFEALIRKQLLRGEDKAVVVLFSVTEAGYSRQDDYQTVAYYYGCPMISVKNAIWPLLEGGQMTWADWSNDDVHPNTNGQAMYAEFITTMLEEMDLAAADEFNEVPEKTKNKLNLVNTVMLDKDNLTPVSKGAFVEAVNTGSFKKGWGRNSTKENEEFTFEFDGQCLLMVYRDTKNENFGTAEVYVDGELKTSVKGYSSNGWNNPDTVCVFRGENGHHTVSIKMAEGQEDKKFDILCFGICE